MPRCIGNYTIRQLTMRMLNRAITWVIVQGSPHILRASSNLSCLGTESSICIKEVSFFVLYTKMTKCVFIDQTRGRIIITSEALKTTIWLYLPQLTSMPRFHAFCAWCLLCKPSFVTSSQAHSPFPRVGVATSSNWNSPFYCISTSSHTTTGIPSVNAAHSSHFLLDF